MSLKGVAYQRDGIIAGWSGVPEVMENRLKAAGQPGNLDPRVYDLALCGSRILLVREESEKEYGNILIPDSVRVKNPPGAGYVVAVGNTVGQGTSPHPHGISLDHPSDLLYHRIVFGMYSGSEFITNAAEGGWQTHYWIMTDRDVWMVDWNSEN